jgi:predicted nucleotidyltransferase
MTPLKRIGMETTITKIVRHSPPTDLDQLPQHTLCFVEQNNKMETYEQKSEDTNKPVWVLREEDNE